MKRKLHIENQMIDVDQLIYKIGSYHYNWHNHLELFWLISGKIEMTIDGMKQEMQEDDLVLINPNCGHATFSLQPNSIAMRLYLDPLFFQENGYGLNDGYFELNSSRERNNPDFLNLRKEMAVLYFCFQEDAMNMIRANRTVFTIADLLTNFYKKDTNKKVNSQIKRQGESEIDGVAEFINNHYSEDISLELLARKCNYSSTYLSRLFKTELGINFYEYLTRCRLVYAVKDLSDADLKISDIAYRNGFSDIKSFNAMFKKHFHQTPSDYRNQLNSEVKLIDRRFKQELSGEENNKVVTRLKKMISTNNIEEDNPCFNCLAKEYEDKYYLLIENMKKILPS